MKKKLLLILWLSILICTSCGRSEQADKLYYSIRTDNLQGLCADEVFILELLSSGKIDVNNPEDGMTYLNYAISNGFSLEIAESLIGNGADINAGEETCLEALLEIAYPDMYDKDERIDFCVEHGAIVDERLLATVLKNSSKYIYYERDRTAKERKQIFQKSTED